MLREIDRKDHQRDRDVENESERKVVMQHGSEPVELTGEPVDKESIRNEKSERRNHKEPQF